MWIRSQDKLLLTNVDTSRKRAKKKAKRKFEQTKDELLKEFEYLKGDE